MTKHYFKLIIYTFLLVLLNFFPKIEGFSPSIIEEMTIEEKVGQILMVFFKGEIANEEAKMLIEKAHIGNFIYYKWANGLHSPQQVLELSTSLQKIASQQIHSIPLLIAVDQEGGVVNRLITGFTQFPNNQFLAEANRPDLIEEYSYLTGLELLAVGINMNLAPVVDVNSNPLKKGMGVRSYGSSPELVSQLGERALKGYKRANIIATLKHFPGYGEAEVDPHLDLPVVNKSKCDLKKTELLPFKQLASLAPAIMTAHIFMPALDPKNCATLSKKIVYDILREEWGYQGIIITDSLVMQGILNSCQSIEEAAVRAFEAGHDILLFGGKLLGQKDSKDLTAEDIVLIHEYIVRSVKQGRISIERLNQSVERILHIKKS